MLRLILQLLLPLIHNTAHRKVHLPKNSLQQSPIDVYNDKMHQHEEYDDGSIQMLVVETVIVDHLRPSTLRQDLNHHVLRMDESLEIGELCKLSVR